jgi:DNA-binding beta-propeller fold protein YncE
MKSNASHFISSFGGRGRAHHELNRPHDLCYLSPPFSPSSSSSPASSVLLVADTDNQRLAIWGVSSNHHHHQPISHVNTASCPRGVCVDLAGYVYVSCGGYFGGAQVVEVRDRRMNFSLLQTLGGEQGAGPGQFNAPTGLCVDDTNTLMVVDHENHRVQFFD